jgi:putative FmdB family regulatory protein
MPTYAYRCDSCDHELELFQKIVEAPATHCPKCGKETLRRGPGGGIGLLFTGTGWNKDSYGLANDTPPPSKSSDCCPCGKAKNGCSS